MHFQLDMWPLAVRCFEASSPPRWRCSCHNTLIVCVHMQVRVLTRAYKLLGMLAKAHQLPKSATNKQLPPEFESLVSMVNRDLTHRVYHFIIDDQEVGGMLSLFTSLAPVWS